MIAPAGQAGATHTATSRHCPRRRAASALASAMLKGGDSLGLRHAARHAGANLLPVDTLAGTAGSGLGAPSLAAVACVWWSLHDSMDKCTP